jgi:hypothetical protein
MQFKLPVNSAIKRQAISLGLKFVKMGNHITRKNEPKSSDASMQFKLPVDSAIKRQAISLGLKACKM